jgi:hypothetical protein
MLFTNKDPSTIGKAHIPALIWGRYSLGILPFGIRQNGVLNSNNIITNCPNNVNTATPSGLYDVYSN